MDFLHVQRLFPEAAAGPPIRLTVGSAPPGGAARGSVLRVLAVGEANFSFAQACALEVRHPRALADDTLSRGQFGRSADAAGARAYLEVGESNVELVASSYEDTRSEVLRKYPEAVPILQKLSEARVSSEVNNSQ